MRHKSEPLPVMSIIIPTRERAAYLEHAIQTCLANPESSLEIVVLDNASSDNTSSVVSGFKDARVRYARSDTRLSMRANFERGLDAARGEYICFIGDDDGLLPNSVNIALDLFAKHEIDAISAELAHYYWPDLVASRSNTILVPRHTGVSLRNSCEELRGLLKDNHYFRLPCIYHGFVRRSAIDRIHARQGEFFLSSQVDIYSAIALSMENMRFAHSESPLVINGGSARSNGASHFGGGTSTEKALWKKEDELGFLPGFEDYATVGSLIVESALRYCAANGNVSLFDVFEEKLVYQTMLVEREARRKQGRPLEVMNPAFEAAGIALPDESSRPSASGGAAHFAERMIGSFLRMRPVDTMRNRINNVNDAAHHIGNLVTEGRTGLLDEPVEQIRTACRIAFGK